MNSEDFYLVTRWHDLTRDNPAIIEFMEAESVSTRSDVYTALLFGGPKKIIGMK